MDDTNLNTIQVHTWKVWENKYKLVNDYCRKL